MIKDPVRVRVAVRLRPRNAQDLSLDSDFSDCVELQPEVTSSSSSSYLFVYLFLLLLLFGGGGGVVVSRFQYYALSL